MAHLRLITDLNGQEHITTYDVRAIRQAQVDFWAAVDAGAFSAELVKIDGARYVKLLGHESE